jgi:hypothetical protein
MTTTVKKPCKTAMKFLNLAAGYNRWSHRKEGTHRDNLKDWVWELLDAGYLEFVNPPSSTFVRTTAEGDNALAIHVANGGKIAKR